MNEVVKNRTRDFIREWRGFIIFLAVMFSFRSAIADWNQVPSGSMLPTVLIGDRIFVDKLAYDLKVPFTTMHLALWDNPRRGDIVVFYSPADGERLIKRVIGLPGDVIAMRDNRLVVEGESISYADRRAGSGEEGQPQEILMERLGSKAHLMMTTPQRPALRTFTPVRVPDGAYLVMGDNRDNSNDSRFIGFVPRDAIVGRVSRVAFSLDPDRWFAPRTDRFFTALD
jgi:signal peptidase I